MSHLCKEIYSHRIRDVKNSITRIRIAHASNESLVAGPNVMVRWSCDMPPHMKMAVAMMAKLKPARTINEIGWRRGR